MTTGSCGTAYQGSQGKYGLATTANRWDRQRIAGGRGPARHYGP